MTFIEFIKLQLSSANPIGDLANDVMRDKEFPIDETTENIISYLDFKTKLGGTNEIFKEFLKEYQSHLLSNPKNDSFQDFIESSFSILYTEKWQYYKKHFSIDRVYLIGTKLDIYRLYCENTKYNIAISLDIKSTNDLNDISLIDNNKIQIGEFTQLTTVDGAINELENCPYETPIKPNVFRFKEILNFLKLNV